MLYRLAEYSSFIFGKYIYINYLSSMMYEIGLVELDSPNAALDTNLDVHFTNMLRLAPQAAFACKQTCYADPADWYMYVEIRCMYGRNLIITE